jgi:hypothetical protein
VLEAAATRSPLKGRAEPGELGDQRALYLLSERYGRVIAFEVEVGDRGGREATGRREVADLLRGLEGVAAAGELLKRLAERGGGRAIAEPAEELDAGATRSVTEKNLPRVVGASARSSDSRATSARAASACLAVDERGRSASSTCQRPSTLLAASLPWAIRYLIWRSDLPSSVAASRSEIFMVRGFARARRCVKLCRHSVDKTASEQR